MASLKQENKIINLVVARFGYEGHRDKNIPKVVLKIIEEYLKHSFMRRRALLERIMRQRTICAPFLRNPQYYYYRSYFEHEDDAVVFRFLVCPQCGNLRNRFVAITIPRTRCNCLS